MQETLSDSDEIDLQHNSDRHVDILRVLLARAVAAAKSGHSFVERPLSSHSSCAFSPLSFDRAGPLVRSSQRWSWARFFTQRLWTFGYAEEALASIFDALPAGFCAAIETASDRLTGLLRHASQACISDGASTAAAESHALAWDEDGEVCRAHGEDAFLECIEDIWERDGVNGFIELAFDPATQVIVETLQSQEHGSWSVSIV